MRLIDADALIDDLETVNPIYDTKWVKSIVEAQPTFESRSKGKWIPCSERLPKEDEEVLVYLYGNVPVIAWLDSGRWCSEDFDIAKEDEPEVWMPLPQPYMRGDKE